MKQKREIWIDNVKVIACILVILGHFFQSMLKAQIVPGNRIYLWFNQSIYSFHVPLFFICSGYLYQKFSRIDSMSKWVRNIWKKLLVLGIPYFVFSSVQWLLKTMFSNTLNVEMDGFLQVLFAEPLSPYWYLYCLYFIFLITPTFNSGRSAVFISGTALILKLLKINGVYSNIYIIDVVMSNEIWFAMGMCLYAINITGFSQKKAARNLGCVSFIVFLIASMIHIPDTLFWEEGKAFYTGIWACAAVILLVAYSFRNSEQDTGFWGFFAKYTMPLFLMHTLFGATVRTLLLKAGTDSIAIHILIGIPVSFIGPVLLAEIMRRYRLDFFLYPGKYIFKK